MSTDFIKIYPVNPQSLAKLRKALYPSGAKSDPADAELLEEMVRQNPGHFRSWMPGDELTRRLQLLTEGRRKFVEDMTALTNQLTSALKTYYPQALDWAGELPSEQACAFLEKWPTLTDLQKSRAFRVREFYVKYGRPRHEVLNERVKQIQSARSLTEDSAVVIAGVMMVRTLVAQIASLRIAIAKYDQEIKRIFHQHPDRAVFNSFPGAGKVLAPRLLAAFGADRDRFQTALEVQQFSGVAPVTERSGKAIGQGTRKGEKYTLRRGGESCFQWLTKQRVERHVGIQQEKAAFAEVALHQRDTIMPSSLAYNFPRIVKPGQRVGALN